MGVGPCTVRYKFNKFEYVWSGGFCTDGGVMYRVYSGPVQEVPGQGNSTEGTGVLYRDPHVERPTE